MPCSIENLSYSHCLHVHGLQFANCHGHGHDDRDRDRGLDHVLERIRRDLCWNRDCEKRWQ